jgi:DedD protein
VPARSGGTTVAAAPAKPVRPAPAPAPAAEAPVDAPPAVSPSPSPSPSPAAATAAPAPAPASKPAVAVAPTPSPSPAAVAASKPAPKVAKAEDSERAKSLLEGKPTAATTTATAPKDGRFVVQAGAYTDAAALREARDKIERLGLKTYTQVVETDAGRRTRVRIGPFASREEADRAAAKLKGAALPAAVLTL